MTKSNEGAHDSQKAAELRRMGASDVVVKMMDKGLLSRDPATLTSAAAAANDIGDTGKALRFNKEAYAKSGGKPSEHQRNSFNRTMAGQRRAR
jgi:hypothetical protein